MKIGLHGRSRLKPVTAAAAGLWYEKQEYAGTVPWRAGERALLAEVISRGDVWRHHQGTQGGTRSPRLSPRYLLLLSTAFARPMALGALRQGASCHQQGPSAFSFPPPSLPLKPGGKSCMGIGRATQCGPGALSCGERRLTGRSGLVDTSASELHPPRGCGASEARVTAWVSVYTLPTLPHL